MRVPPVAERFGGFDQVLVGPALERSLEPHEPGRREDAPIPPSLVGSPFPRDDLPGGVLSRYHRRHQSAPGHRIGHARGVAAYVCVAVRYPGGAAVRDVPGAFRYRIVGIDYPHAGTDVHPVAGREGPFVQALVPLPERYPEGIR